MPFTATNFVGAIIAACAPLFTGAHGLAIHDGTAGLRFATRGSPHLGPHVVVDFLPCAVAPPPPEVVINGSPRRHIIEDAIQDFMPSMLGGTAARFGGGHQRLQLVPFGIGEFGSVGIAGCHPASLRDTFQTPLRNIITGLVEASAAIGIHCYRS